MPEYTIETRPGGIDAIRSAPAPELLQTGDDSLVAVPRNPPEEPPCERDDAPKPGSIGRKILWICAILAVLWLFGASSPLLANALSQEGWRMWASLGLGALPLAFVLTLAAWAWMKLRRLPAIAKFKSGGAEGKAALRRRITAEYLDKIPDPEDYIDTCALATEEAAAARADALATLVRLKDPSPRAYCDSSAWLDDFKRFQAWQDARADEIIKRAAKLVALKTAASPWKIVDMAAVFYNSTVMTTRLARLYHRRVSSAEAFRLAVRWFMNIYISSQMGDATQSAAEWATANDFIATSFKPLAGLVGKIAEGGANAFLVCRLGRRAQNCFQVLED